MSGEPWIWTIEESIPSRVGAGEPFSSQVLDRLAQEGWARRDVFGVRLAMEEALTNAIKHGNRLDPAKQVFACCKLSDRRIRIVIRDQGMGFEPEDVPDPIRPENLDVPSGRGVMLIDKFMSRVQYRDGGTVVVMEKDRSGR